MSNTYPPELRQGNDSGFAPQFQKTAERENKMPDIETTAMDFELVDPPVETKSERFTRVINYRLGVAIERLRLMGQMFDGATASNYEFTAEQVDKLESILGDELDSIVDTARRVIAKRSKTHNVGIPHL